MNRLMTLSFLLALAFGLQAQPTLIASASTTSTSGSVNMTGANFLVACVYGYFANPCASTGSGGSALSDSSGNTWVQYGTSATNNPAGVCIRYVANPTVTSSQTFTISNGSPAVIVYGFSGMATSALTDGTASATTGSTSTLQPGSITPTQNNDLIITCSSAGAAPATPTVDSGFSSPIGILNSGGQAREAAAYLIQSTAAAINPTWTWAVTANEAATIAAFKSAPATTRARHRVIAED